MLGKSGGSGDIRICSEHCVLVDTQKELTAARRTFLCHAEVQGLPPYCHVMENRHSVVGTHIMHMIMQPVRQAPMYEGLLIYPCGGILSSK
jgi:hypothetical protein